MSTLPRRRSDPGQRHLRISFSDCSEEEGARRCSYLVRMIKPNLIGSHDWHVQPSCQRSFDGPPKRCRLDRGLSSNAQVSPNLLRCWFFAYLRPPAFWRELFEVIELPAPCQDESGATLPIPSGHRAAQNIKEQPAQRACATKARERSFTFRVMQWLVLCGIPYRGPGGASNAASTLTLRTGFPLPSSGGPNRPPGGSTALTATFRE